MSRNASGTFSLVAGNPVTTGTAISSTWANDTLSDLETEITASLDRNGKGGMLAPLRGTDGSISAPAVSWTSETGSGFYRAGAGDVRISVLGADIARFLSGTGFQIWNGVSWDTIAVTTGGLDNLVDDTTPQLGGSLDVNGNSIVSAASGNITITPNGTGNIVLDGQRWPQADGTANQVLKTDGVGQTAWASSLTLTGITISSSVSFSGATVSNGGTVTTIDINGGTIDGTNVGSSVAGTGNFSTLSIGGTAITATAAEINIIDGVTASFAELNYNDITTLGTAQASKVVTASAGSAITLTGMTITDADINSGSVDGATVGAASHSTGKFTTLQATGALTLGAEVIETVFTVTGTNPALDPANGTVQSWALGASQIPTSALATGESITLRISRSGAYTVTWPTMTWVGGTAVTIPAAGYAWVVLFNVAGTLYGVHTGDSA